MLIVEFEEIELDACPECPGIWFDAQELNQLFHRIGTPEQMQDLEQQLQRLTHSQTRRSCPRCHGRLEPVGVPDRDDKLILDQCPRGHGLWFDQGELESLFQAFSDESSDALSRVRRYLGHFATSGLHDEAP
jgi:Zn-finger nucleic acid-binding protein